jgi:hypothetical protein
VASKRVKLHTSVSSDTMNKDAVKGSAWHRKSAKKQKASSASSTPVEQTSSDESMKTLSADVQGDDMADTSKWRYTFNTFSSNDTLEISNNIITIT